MAHEPYTVHTELVDMQMDGGLDELAATAGATRIRAAHARELATAARASGTADAEAAARFLDAYAAELDG